MTARLFHVTLVSASEEHVSRALADAAALAGGERVVLRLDGAEAWSPRWTEAVATRLAWIETCAEPPLETEAGGAEPVPIDFLMNDPAAQAPLVHRVARAARRGRPARLTVPARPGLLKAVQVAVSLGLRVRLDLGQPDPSLLEELGATIDLYLRGPGTEAPVEPWHTALAWALGAGGPGLWEVQEHDPELHRFVDACGRETGPRGEGAPLDVGFVAAHGARLAASGAECVGCELRGFCAGYFNWPEPGRACGGVRALFDRLREAARELRQDLAAAEALARVPPDDGSPC